MPTVAGNPIVCFQLRAHNKSDQSSKENGSGRAGTKPGREAVSPSAPVDKHNTTTADTRTDTVVPVGQRQLPVLAQEATEATMPPHQWRRGAPVVPGPLFSPVHFTENGAERRQLRDRGLSLGFSGSDALFQSQLVHWERPTDGLYLRSTHK